MCQMVNVLTDDLKKNTTPASPFKTIGLLFIICIICKWLCCGIFEFCFYIMKKNFFKKKIGCILIYVPSSLLAKNDAKCQDKNEEYYKESRCVQKIFLNIIVSHQLHYV